MVFDEAELAALRKNAPDFKESYDMGEHKCPPTERSDLTVQDRTSQIDAQTYGLKTSISQVSRIQLKHSWSKVCSYHSYSGS